MEKKRRNKREMNIFREIVSRSLLGMPLGITISYLISIGVSLAWGQGYFAACVPKLVEIMGNEIRAVVLQAALSALLGAVFGGASVIWDIEDLSIVKQTGLYFLIAAAAMLPVAYLAQWMEHSVKGLLTYFGFFVVIFAVVWVIQYTRGRRMVAKMNEKLK